MVSSLGAHQPRTSFISIGRLLVAALLLAFLACAAGARAQGVAPQENGTQNVAARNIGTQNVTVFDVPPYAMQDGDGRWHGPAVDLFRGAADRAGLDYCFVGAGEAQGGAEAQTAFPVFARAGGVAGQMHSLPFHIDSIGVIKPEGAANSSAEGFMQGLAGLFNMGFLKVVGILCVLLLIVGTIFWLVERSGNDDVGSEGTRMGGIGDGFWWAGVTATTIGYGDLVPKTVSGRIVAMVWMLFSMALTAILTAYLVSLTGAKGGHSSLSDAISGKHAGYVVDGPVPRRDLESAGTVDGFASLSDALNALDAERIDLVVYPYQAAKSASGDRDVQRTGGTAAMPMVRVAGPAKLRTELDRVILSPDWQQRMEDQFSSK